MKSTSSDWQYLGLCDVADPGLRHDRDRHRLLDPADHARVRHAGDTAVATDVGGDPFEGHDRAGAGLLGDLRLFGVDHVHDHAALQHLCEAGLDSECRFFSHPHEYRDSAVASHRSRAYFSL